MTSQKRFRDHPKTNSSKLSMQHEAKQLRNVNVNRFLNSTYSLLNYCIIRVMVKGSCTSFRITLVNVNDAVPRSVLLTQMNPGGLKEEDKHVPGASLNGRKPKQLRIPELKLWLACRGALTKGRKAELIERQVH